MLPPLEISPPPEDDATKENITTGDRVERSGSVCFEDTPIISLTSEEMEKFSNTAARRKSVQLQSPRSTPNHLKPTKSFRHSISFGKGSKGEEKKNSRGGSGLHGSGELSGLRNSGGKNKEQRNKQDNEECKEVIVVVVDEEMKLSAAVEKKEKRKSLYLMTKNLFQSDKKKELKDVQTNNSN